MTHQLFLRFVETEEQNIEKKNCFLKGPLPTEQPEVVCCYCWFLKGSAPANSPDTAVRLTFRLRPRPL